MSNSYLEEIAFAKLNLNLRVIKKLPNNYHYIQSYITFLPQLYDTLQLKKNNKNIITIIGSQSNYLRSIGGDTLIKKSIKKLSDFLKINICLDIRLEKNIPVGAGLGGGSADAAAIIRGILRLYKVKKKNIEECLKEIGSDVPVCFYSKNSEVSGTGEIVKKLPYYGKKLWVLLIKPDTFYSTKDIFNKFNGPYVKKSTFTYTIPNLIKDMNSKKNSLESTVCKVAPKVKELIEKLPTENCIAKPRISGSGSVVYILFERKKDLIYYKEKLSFGKKITWCLSSYLRL